MRYVKVPCPGRELSPLLECSQWPDPLLCGHPDAMTVRGLCASLTSVPWETTACLSEYVPVICSDIQLILLPLCPVVQGTMALWQESVYAMLVTQLVE